MFLSINNKLNITLCGMMGSGKSAVGKIMAKKIDYNFIDIDRLIEKKAKKSISNIFEEDGERYFRYLEQKMHRLIKEQHPELDIRFVFSNINGKVQRSKLTCAEWCEKHNFQYAQENIPIEWIEHVKKKRN